MWFDGKEKPLRVVNWLQSCNAYCAMLNWSSRCLDLRVLPTSKSLPRSQSATHLKVFFDADCLLNGGACVRDAEIPRTECFVAVAVQTGCSLDVTFLVSLRHAVKTTSEDGQKGTCKTREESSILSKTCKAREESSILSKTNDYFRRICKC